VARPRCPQRAIRPRADVQQAHLADLTRPVRVSVAGVVGVVTPAYVAPGRGSPRANQTWITSNVAVHDRRRPAKLISEEG
jgi:hypothetical protein